MLFAASTDVVAVFRADESRVFDRLALAWFAVNGASGACALRLRTTFVRSIVSFAGRDWASCRRCASGLTGWVMTYSFLERGRRGVTSLPGGNDTKKVSVKVVATAVLDEQHIVLEYNRK